MSYIAAGSSTETPGTLPSLLDKLEREAGEKNLSAEDVAAQANAARLANLEASAFQWIARGREANIELGRVFNQIKSLVGHGNWETYYEATFTPLGVALRTAQAYMKMAGEADEAKKNANLALFPPANDPQAAAVNAASEQAKQEVANATDNASAPTEPKPVKKPRKPRLRLNGSYSLPLFLTGEQKDNLDELRKSQNWRGAELAIIATIERLFVQYGLVNPPAPPESQAATQPRKKLETLPEEPFAATDNDLPSEFFPEGVTEEEPEYENALA
jgi:hypothetical protein